MQRLLQRVPVRTTVRKDEVRNFLSNRDRHTLRQAVQALQGKRILHVNATARGGGVAELLHSFIPLTQGLSLATSWYALAPQRHGTFFQATNVLHNAMQGLPVRLSPAQQRLYEQTSARITQAVQAIPHDLLVVHDPQLLLAGAWCPGPKVFVLHVDTSTVDAQTWHRLLPAMRAYDQVIFSNRRFVHPGLSTRAVRIIPPAIDPWAPKQARMPRRHARQLLHRYHVPATGPLIVQVSRFDVWKNPLGLVNAFRMVQRVHPSAQLLLVGFREAKDNPAANIVYRDLAAIVGSDPNIQLFYNPSRIGGSQHIRRFTTLAQNAADIVVQNSVREGFGLTVTEAMWKEQAVIGGPALGIRTQIRPWKDGYIAQTTPALARWLIRLIDRPQERRRLGKAARQRVRAHFLMPRFALDHLRTYAAVVEAKSLPGAKLFR